MRSKIIAKKLINLAKKWKKKAAVGRKRISFTRPNRPNSSSSTSTGHFVIYTTDDRQFSLPLPYLSNTIFKELFKMSEDVFGLPSEGPIKLPCDAVFMEYVLSLVQKGFAKDIEKALLTSMETSSCSSVAASQGHSGQQFFVCSH